jgi:hypothetical protein
MIGRHHRGWPLLQPRRAAGRTAGLVAGAVAVVSGSEHHEVMADPGEAARQQVAVARDAGQILMQSQILMES